MTNDQRAAWRKMCDYINETPALMSMLYDIDLLPEQIKEEDERRSGYLASVVEHWKMAIAEAVALERERCISKLRQLIAKYEAHKDPGGFVTGSDFYREEIVAIEDAIRALEEEK